MAGTAIAIDGLRVVRGATTALDGVSLRIAAGRVGESEEQTKRLVVQSA